VPVVERRPEEHLGHRRTMLTSVGKVPLRLCLREAQPERRTGSWGQPRRMDPMRARHR
jgi:hypothetical protein